MMTTDSKRITRKWLCLLVLLCGALAGCVDDDLIDCLGGDAQGSTLAPDEYGIGFELSLDNLGGAAATRADWREETGTTDENYVNFDNMRVLLFDIEDNFICDVLANSDACNVIDRSTGAERRWYIEINLSRLTLDDNKDENAEKVAKFRQLIETDGFKIAVFANWDKRLNEGRVQHPDFRSIWDEEIEDGDKPKQKLAYIAHNMIDPTYGRNISEEGVKHAAYKHVVAGELAESGTTATMGAYYDWVESHFSSAKDADQLMRSNSLMINTSRSADSFGDEAFDTDGLTHSVWSYKDTSKEVTAVTIEYDDEGNTDGFCYSRTERDGQKYTFKNIWNLWNFSNGEKFPYYDQTKYTAATPAPNPVNYVDEHWTEINKDFSPNSNMPTPVNSIYTFNKGTFNELELHTNNSNDYNRTEGYITLTSQGNYNDVVMNGAKITTDYIYFKMEATGTLHVRAKVNGGNIGVHVGAMSNDESQNRSARTIDEVDKKTDVVIDDRNNSDDDIKEYRFLIKVSNNDDKLEDVYIYAVNGSVDIYEIEFVKDEYLYLADRIGKQPGEIAYNINEDDKGKMGIPMYGIQEFEPVGDYWMPGEFFNVSRDAYNSNRPNQNYRYRSVFLLRSVAKVELLVSKHLNGENGEPITPSSVYMASMNRDSRYEPKDFSTPTNLIWYGSKEYENNKNYQYFTEDGTPKYLDIPGVGNEEANIIDYGPMYNPNLPFAKAKEDDPRIAPDYHNFTAWLYGIWQTIMDWDWNGEDVNRDANKVGDYPRVFNDRVWRSNLTRFIRGEDRGNYYYYYLYVPDKYIDDADDTGNRTKVPKVASIRVRFNDGYTDDTNLEDGRSYRIYFTDGGIADPNFVGRGSDRYKAYERETDAKYLKKHWPIIRNTLYRFTLDGLNSTDIKVEVCSPAKREVAIPDFE